MKFDKRRGRKKRSNAPLVIVSIVIIVAVALGLAWFWQNTQGKLESSSSLQEPVSTDSSAPAVEPKVVEPVVAPEVSTPEESEVEIVEPPEEVVEAGEPGREAFTYVVKETAEPVGDAYFEDAIFFGDSISTGIPLYLPALAEVPVVAKQGVNLSNASTIKKEYIAGAGEQTMLAAAEKFGERSKVYILLGSNDLGLGKESFVGIYSDFLDEMIAKYPKATIYVQGMTPVTDHATQFYPSIGTGNVNPKIEEYNLAIMELAKTKGVKYLDIASALVDANGNLPREASASDGMHFGAKYYQDWLDYLKTHTV